MAGVLERALLKKIYTLLYSSALPSSVWGNEDIENVSPTFPCLCMRYWYTGKKSSHFEAYAKLRG